MFLGLIKESLVCITKEETSDHQKVGFFAQLKHLILNTF